MPVDTADTDRPTMMTQAFSEIWGWRWFREDLGGFPGEASSVNNFRVEAVFQGHERDA
jgi:hypothetical protein